MENKIKKIFRVFVNEDDDTGLFGIGLVNSPANKTDFIYMSDDNKIDIKMNDEKRIISGIVLRPNQLIRRYNSETKEEEYWYFDVESIQFMVEKFFKDNYNNNVNIEHQIYGIEGVNLLESYFIDRKRGIDPIEFKTYEDLSWIVSYKVNNDSIWNDVKNGTFQGFSIDGYIEKELVKIDVKMNESKNESKIEKLNKTIDEYKKLLETEKDEINISVIDYWNEFVK